MRRRRFLQIAAAGTIAGAAAPQAGFAEIDRGLDQLAHPDMLRRIGSHRLIRTLGDAYRLENPNENDAHRLGHLILDEAKYMGDPAGRRENSAEQGSHREISALQDSHREVSAEQSRHRGISGERAGYHAGPGEYPGDLRARLDRLVRHDFAAGDTVQVCGWIISRTEARQCALYSLLYA